MSADWYTAQQEILNLLGTDSRLAHVTVYDTSVPDSTSLPLLPSGTVAPHVIVDFAGTQDRKSAGSSGIVGAAFDSVTGQFTVSSVAGVPVDARKLHQIVCDVLIGFEPTNCGEISPAFFAGVAGVAAQSTPTRYVAGQSFDLLVNSTDQ